MPDKHSDPTPGAQQDHLSAPEERRPSWRDTLPVHAACEMFPLMSPDELRDLGEDIKQNGLLSPILLWTYDRLNDDEPVWLLDGRNRLDALEVALGRPVRVVCRVRRDHSNKFKIWTIETDGDDGKATPITNYLIPASVDLLTLSHVLVLGGNEDIDPFAYVISANIHRRHLTTEQKRDLIGKLLQARPAQSNVTIAKQVKVDDKTVAKVRRELEATSEIPKLEKTVGADGKSRPAKRKQRNQGNVEAELAAGRNRIIGEDLAEQEPADQFRPGVAELPAATDVQLLQARISELEAALNQRDIRIAGLEKKVRHLLQVRKAAAADDELSDQCTAKHNAARNKGSKIQRSDAFESYINYLQKIGCDIEIRATRPKADQPADQDPAPTEAPTTTTLQ
jgi:hypothetical protein